MFPTAKIMYCYAVILMRTPGKKICQLYKRMKMLPFPIDFTAFIQSKYVACTLIFIYSCCA